MRTQSIIWKPHTSAGAPSIRSFENKQNRLYVDKTPDLSQLRHGEAICFGSGGPYEIDHPTPVDRILFQNGGSVCDKDNGGLIIRTPEGRTFEANGEVEMDHRSGAPVVRFTTEDEYEEMTFWEQSFPEEGGTVIRKSGMEYEDAVVTIANDGTMSGEMDGLERAPLRVERRGDVLLVDDYVDTWAVKPPVDLDWVITS